jgi:hypothetical protein
MRWLVLARVVCGTAGEQLAYRVIQHRVLSFPSAVFQFIKNRATLPSIAPAQCGKNERRLVLR